MIQYPLRSILPSGSTITFGTVAVITLFNFGVLWQKAGRAWVAIFIAIALFGGVFSWLQSERKKQKKAQGGEKANGQVFSESAPCASSEKPSS
jgi:hypothetical protein